VRQGDVYLADLGEPVGHEQGGVRPVVILSSAAWLRIERPVVHVAPLTTTHYASPLRVEVEPDAHNGLDEVSWVRCEDITATSPGRLMHRIGELDYIRTTMAVAMVQRLISIR
jgi:mRNA interferase MazF